MLVESLPAGCGAEREGGDEDSPALSELLVKASRAGGAATPGEVPGVVLDVDRRSLEACARAAAPLGPFRAPFFFPLFVTSIS